VGRRTSSSPQDAQSIALAFGRSQLQEGDRCMWLVRRPLTFGPAARRFRQTRAPE
jgi:hypothetical protein